MAWTEQQTKIHAALNQLMKACDLSGESGTERMFGILSDAIDNVDWSIVEQSHRDGLCYDVNCLLTDAIIDAQRPHEPDAAAPETEPETVTETIIGVPTKIDQIKALFGLVGEFSRQDRECHCPGCFANAIFDAEEMGDDDDEPHPLH